MRNLAVFLFAFLLLLAVTGFALYYWYTNAIAMPNGMSQAPVVFEVLPGDSVEEIADNMVEQGILRDKWAFIIHAKIYPDLVAKFQAGYFEMTAHNSVVELFTILQKAKNKDDLKLTIVEGLRYDEIAEVLDREFQKVPGTRFSKDEFLAIAAQPSSVPYSVEVATYLSIYKPQSASLEGYLYPDTYFFAKDSDAKAVIEKLVLTLFLKIDPDDLAFINTSNYSFNQYLTMASLIEREALALDEEPMIADIILKRMEEGINGLRLLQIDASLLYPVKDWKADAFKLKTVDNPYNTYMHPGLPPSPICNPGIHAITSALYPSENDYFYYLHDSEGNIHYAKTYSEHLSNIKRYL